MSVPELLYFPVHGRGLYIKLAFKLGNVEFKDTEINPPEFMAMKACELVFRAFKKV